MSSEKKGSLSFSNQVVDSIVDSMYGVETPQQKVRRQLSEQGVFYHLKSYAQKLPDLPEETGLKVESTGIIFDLPQIGLIDGFIVYDPRRVEIKIETDDEERSLNYWANRRRRKLQIDPPSKSEEKEEGWETPFPKSRGRVVRYRLINQPIEQ